VIGLSKRMFLKLVGASSVTGTLMVKAMSQSGTLVGVGNVMIDEEARGKLSAGRVTLSGLAEGRHVLAIEAGGYRRFEETVTIHGGEQATLNALLLMRDSASDEPSAGSASTWKIALGASIAVAAVGGVVTGISALQVYREGVTYKPDPNSSLRPIDVTDADCGQAADQILASKHAIVTNQTAFDRACTWKPRIYVGFAITGVGVIGAAISYVMLSRGTESERPRTSARLRKPSVAVAPIVTPALTGASLSVAW
ncbi:MAG: PEGA domain-containing protein, partial [Kofleriaceae bacterium]